jgi:hypothetical protein
MYISLQIYKGNFETPCIADIVEWKRRDKGLPTYTQDVLANIPSSFTKDQCLSSGRNI